MQKIPMFFSRRCAYTIPAVMAAGSAGGTVMVTMSRDSIMMVLAGTWGKQIRKSEELRYVYHPVFSFIPEVIGLKNLHWFGKRGSISLIFRKDCKNPGLKVKFPWWSKAVGGFPLNLMLIPHWALQYNKSSTVTLSDSEMYVSFQVARKTSQQGRSSVSSNIKDLVKLIEHFLVRVWFGIIPNQIWFPYFKPPVSSEPPNQRNSKIRNTAFP